MSFLRHGQIYQSDGLANRGQRSPAAPAIVSMSLRPAIPWRVGLHQSPPPLRRLLSILKEVAVGVNRHRMKGGEFSTGETRNIHPALTKTGEPATKVSSPALIGISLRQDTPGGLLSSRARFRFFCQDHSETEESRCQEKCSEWRGVPFVCVSKLDTVHECVPCGHTSLSPSGHTGLSSHTPHRRVPRISSHVRVPGALWAGRGAGSFTESPGLAGR